MANVTETSNFDEGVYRIETTDLVVGGENGIANKGIKNLANRTKYLKDQSDSFAGSVAAFATVNAPSGWLKCNGQAVSRTTYARLFELIGTTFGVGNGTTTFNVPDLRAEFIRGFDDSRGIDNNSITLACVTGFGQTTIGVVDGTSGLFAGMSVTGTNVPANTTIISIDSRSQITVSNATTAIGSPNLTFSFNRTFGSSQADMIKKHEHFIAKEVDSINAQNPKTEEKLLDWEAASVNDRFGASPKNTEHFGGAETRPRNIALLYCIKF